MLPQGRAYVRGARAGMRIREVATSIVRGLIGAVLSAGGFVFGLYEGIVQPDIATQVINAVEKKEGE